MPPRAHPRISEAEREIMSVLWHESPLSTPEIVTRLTERKGWAPRTIRTLLARLVKKRALLLSSEGRRHVFRPRLNRETSVQQESRSFLARVFGGKPASMLISLVQQTDLTPEEIRQLKAILADKEK